MALLGREFIAVPDDRKNQIVFKHPDNNIRKFTRAIVDADELGLFVNKGQVIGTLPPGQHQIDAQELPFLGAVIDHVTGGNAYRAELFFVGTREYTGQPFGGRIDDVQDPQTGMIVTLRVFGDYALKVIDPGKLVLNLTGTVDVTNNEAITGWVAQQILKVTRTTVTTQLASGTWPILGLSVHSPEIEVAVKQAANSELADYGISITRLGNLDVNLDDDDNARLKKLAGDTAYSRLAGGFLQAAQAEALQGAGEGMSKGGEGVTPMFFGAGMGMANQMMQAPQQAPYNPPPPGTGFAGGGQGYAQPQPQQPQQAQPQEQPPPQAPAPVEGAAPAAPATVAAATTAATVECGNCHNQVPASGKFCAECGTPMQKHCTNCNASLGATAKFCAECGTPANPPAS